jgi:hypothetical protein
LTATLTANRNDCGMSQWTGWTNKGTKSPENEPCGSA